MNFTVTEQFIYLKQVSVANQVSSYINSVIFALLFTVTTYLEEYKSAVEAYDRELTQLSENVKFGLSKCLQPCRKSILNVELLYSEKPVCFY